MKKRTFIGMVAEALDEMRKPRNTTETDQFTINWAVFADQATKEKLPSTEIGFALRALVETALENRIEILFKSSYKGHISVGRA